MFNAKLHTGASGGGQLGRTRDFLKESDAPDATLVKLHGKGVYKNPTLSLQDYGDSKGGNLRKPKGETKVLKTVKPKC